MKVTTHLSILVGAALAVTQGCTHKPNKATPPPQDLTATTEKAQTPKAPAWFGQPSESSDILFGYGQGENLSAAKNRALQGLSQQRSVWVDSTVETRTEREGGTTERYFKQRARLRSKQRLDNAQRGKTAQRGDRYFVRWRLDLRPPASVLADRLIQQWDRPPSQINWEGSVGILQSPLAKRLKQKIKRGGGPARTVRLVLSRQEEKWAIQANGVQTTLPDILNAVTLAPYETQNLALRLLDARGRAAGKRLTAGQDFYFQIQGSTEGYYCSLFNLYPDGRVSLIFRNQPATKTTWAFPDPEGERILSAATGSPDKVALDRYMAACTPSTQHLLQFRRIEAEKGLVKGEWAHAAHKLLDWLEAQKKGQVAVQQILTVPVN